MQAVQSGFRQVFDAMCGRIGYNSVFAGDGGFMVI